VACGVCLGLGALIRPTYVLLPIPIGIHMLLAWPRRRRALVSAGGIVLGTALAVLPWTARNYRVTGGFVLISSNGGGNLYSANNDRATGLYTPEAWEYVFSHARNDLELQRVGMQCAWDWIRSHPRRFLLLSLQKFLLFWHTDKEIAWWALEQTHTEHPELGIPLRWQRLGQSFSTGYYAACLVAAVVGLWRCRDELRRRRGWIVVTVLCMYFSAVHMVFEAQGKYHYMLVPLLCMFSALAAEPSGRPRGLIGRLGTPARGAAGASPPGPSQA